MIIPITYTLITIIWTAIVIYYYNNNKISKYLKIIINNRIICRLMHLIIIMVTLIKI